jgi:hypothetical protein
MKQVIKFIKQTAIVMAIFAMAVFATSCKKDQPTTPTNGDTELVFDINSILETGNLKSTTVDPPPCSQLKATTVKVTLNGPSYTTDTEVTLDVFYINVGGIDKPYTKGLKVIPGTYTVKEFLVFNNSTSTPSVATLLSATPHLNAPYAEFLSSPTKSVNLTFPVEAFKKNEFKMEVVCYTPEVYENFGFNYFQIEDIIVRTQYFFGDLCIKDVNEYTGTLYSTQGLKLDLAAIFKIKVKRVTAGGVVQNYEYTNNVVADIPGLGVRNPGEYPVKVEYGDFKNSTDHFTFELWVLVRQGTGTDYKLFQTWNFDDISNITEGTDNVVDFVIGNCVQSETDYHFEPYINLPNTCSFSVVMGTNSYLDATLGNFSPAGNYDIYPGLNQVYCGDLGNFVSLNTPYTMKVYSSLYTQDIPAIYTIAKGMHWGRLNWLINNLDQFPGHTWQDVQAAIWRQNNNWTGPAQNGITYSTTAQNMYNEMVIHGGTLADPTTWFSPLPGGWACVIFIDSNAGNATQLEIIKIDP